jgi:hypothetical protein
MQPLTRTIVVDSLAFAGFVLLTTTGFLLHYLLPPGIGRRSLLWGLDRHEWGSVHFYIALASLAVLTLHLFLHRRWPDVSGSRRSAWRIAFSASSA